MKKLTMLTLSATCLLASCGGGEVQKKVLVMGRGGIEIKANEVSLKGGSGHAEETVDVSDEKAVTWNVNTMAEKITTTIPEEKGFYILNLKKDTLVGSRQDFGKDLSSSRTITQEELKEKIDSLTKLTTGANVTLGGRSFFILPNQLVKISANSDARVFGPFKKIPGKLDADKNGKEPEIYKFYTNTEMRELIDKFKKMTSSAN